MANEFADELNSIAQRLAVLAGKINITAPALPSGTLGTTAADWTAPPAPWPIDARFLSAEQIAKLDADATFRANYWQQSLMSAAMAGNGSNPVPAALVIFKAYWTPSGELNKPVAGTVWEQIFKAYGVTPPNG